MKYILYICFLATLCFAQARLQGDCSKGPVLWCSSLKNAADCSAVAHCIDTVWEKQKPRIETDEVSTRFLRLIRALADVKDFVNEEYLTKKFGDACDNESYSSIKRICRSNTAYLETSIRRVLQSNASAESICVAIGMCNNEKIKNVLKLSQKDLDNGDKTKPVKKQHLVGTEKCTWGPSYWCTDLSTSHECKATHHCVQRVWSKMQVPVDNDSICQLCKDMVKQARDQLQSNETQEELKEVFEGSCQLIPIKLIAKECMKIADDFVPELVETLSSEMNPDTVCTVAGLCNNARIDSMLKEYESGLEVRRDCKGCQTIVDYMRAKFDQTPYEDFLTNILQVCRKFDSYSDSCSMLVFAHFEDIYQGVKLYLNKEAVCDLSRQCVYRYHQHPDQFTYPELKDISLPKKDDLPCELCEQLVKHLRDMIVANTTEIEFQKVLTGICKQTGNFKDECLSLVDQWYPVIYNYLVSDLKPKQLCGIIAVCPSNIQNEPVAPFISKELIISSKLIGTDEANSYKPSHDSSNQKQTNVRVVGVEPLPIERMFIQLPQTKTVCAFCEYFLHYLQVEISDQKNEDAIRTAVESACDKLPDSVSDQCKEFVDQYGPAVIALLVQEIDPSSVCPALGLCPKTSEVRKVSINSAGSSCPLCLFAVEQLEAVLKDNRTVANIKNALDNLCSHLSQKLKGECVDFVDTYSNALVEMLLADMNAQEICVYLKLCTDTVADPLGITRGGPKSAIATEDRIDMFHNNPHMMADRNNIRKSLLPAYMLENQKPAGGDIETNEIPDNTYNGRRIRTRKGMCVICEFVMKEIDDQIKDKHNEDELKKVVHGICNHMPKSVKSECNQFVDKYADLVIALLAQELEPAEVCEQINLCPSSNAMSLGMQKATVSIFDCAICQTVAAAVQKVLSNPKNDRSVVNVTEKACNLLPSKYYDRCHSMMEVYGESIVKFVVESNMKSVCGKIGFCDVRGRSYVEIVKSNHQKQSPSKRNT